LLYNDIYKSPEKCCLADDRFMAARIAAVDRRRSRGPQDLENAKNNVRNNGKS